ncbi:MAG: ABC transporter ATP-binding protein [Candidatus Thorarchaeota archaeon]
MKAVVCVEDVWKTYGMGSPREVHALRGVSLTVEEGIVTAIAGPSGSGKTTLLSIMGLLTVPSKGRVYLKDQEMSGFSEIYRTRLRREEIGFVFQSQYLLPHLTAVENVALPLLATDISISEAEHIARDRLIMLGMEHRLDFKVAELSGGEQQRVSIARAMMNDPTILIADEPSSSIDEELTGELLSLVRAMVEETGLTVIVASHDPIVLDWADVRFNMRDGRIVG